MCVCLVAQSCLTLCDPIVCVCVYIYIYIHTKGEIIITIKLINIVISSQLLFYFVVRIPEITLSANF